MNIVTGAFSSSGSNGVYTAITPGAPFAAVTSIASISPLAIELVTT
ncbi:hypothetical protein HDA45_008426 [Amycolatopsis umgeniensis]|uniref:Uncharacterized protein n=1 Tax=Amycolatopsis umgeniensis TaxID=336628 RepID=A0A841BBY5_9PSEU|nr:hypothetical protein [Amycolatopsis umgeniensis]